MSVYQSEKQSKTHTHMHGACSQLYVYYTYIIYSERVEASKSEWNRVSERGRKTNERTNEQTYERVLLYI